MNNTNRENRIKRLIYRSWYRGCKETDKILGQFAKEYLSRFSDSELDSFEAILEESDSDIFDWMSGKQQLPEKYKSNRVIKLLKEFDCSELANNV